MDIKKRFGGGLAAYRGCEAATRLAATASGHPAAVVALGGKTSGGSTRGPEAVIVKYSGRL